MDLNGTSNCSNSSSDTGEQTNDDLDPVIPSSTVQFWTLLLFQIPSLVCNIFLLYHLLANRQLRNALHNHVVIIILFLTLCIEIFDHPLYIDAYRLGGNKNSFSITVPICLMWWFVDYGFYGALTVFLTWGSVERHILVFHYHQFLRTNRQRLFFHYLPLIIISLYLLGFYTGVIFFPPCENIYDFDSLACGLNLCYEDVEYLNAWDYFGNVIFCTVIETIATITLIGRVLLQKRRAHQHVNRRKHRKMAFQLLSISFLSLTIILPESFIIAVRAAGGSNYSNFGSELDPYLFYLCAYLVFLLPFICLWNFPELWNKRWSSNRKQRRIVFPLAQIGQTIASRPKLNE